MASVNRLCISGVIVTDVQRFFRDTTCAKFRISNTFGVKEEAHTQVLDVLVFGEWANRCHSLEKGMRVYIEGKKSHDKKKLISGKMLYWTVILVNDLWNDLLEKM
jgi:single-stranded DNA-binding protein